MNPTALSPLSADALLFDGVRASRIVFFDDLPENIEGARGLIGVQVNSSADVARTLKELGI